MIIRARHALLLILLLAWSAARAQDAPPPPGDEAPEDTPGDVPDDFAQRHLGGPAVLEDSPAAPPAESVPLPAASPELLAWVGRNPALHDIAFRSETHFDPVQVLVQPPAVADEAHLIRLSWTLGTWAHGLDVLFRARYADPARRQARAGHERLSVVSVTDPATFDALRAAAGVRDVWDETAFYEPGLPAVIVLDADPAKGTRGSGDVVRPMLHAAVHALLDAFVEPGRTAPAWLAEGLAERLASHAGTFSERLTSLGVFDTEAFAALAQASLERPQRIACLRSLTDLTGIATLAEVERRAAGLPVPAALPLTGFARESSLFLTWLDEGDAARPGRATQMLVGWLAGRDSQPVLPAGPAELEGEFVGWAQEQIARRIKLPTSTFTLQPDAVTAEEIRPGVLAQPSDLVVPPGDADTERARALQLASRGDVAGAAARCGQLAALPGLPAADAAAMREDQRLLLALQKLRHRWLGEHVGKQIEFHEGDAVLRTALVRVDGERAVIKDKGKERALEESTLVPGILAAQLIAPGNVFAGQDDEARALAWVLAADPAWKDKTATRVRKDAGPSGVAVLDRRPDYDARLALGRTIDALQALAAAPMPLAGASEADRDAWLARLGTVAGGRALPVVATRLPVLRSLGARALAARFDVAPLKHVSLRGKVEDLGAGRVRTTWSFDDAAQLEDWTARPFEADAILPYDDLPSAPSPAGLVVEEGWLAARGSGDWRFKVPIAAPFTIDYDLRYVDTPAEVAARARGETDSGVKLVAAFGLRMCTDDYGSGLSCCWFGDLHALDKRAAAHADQASSLDGIFRGKHYHLRIEHDGQRLRAKVDGQEVSSINAIKRLRGAVEIWHHTERPIELDNLVIEGALDLGSMTSEREAWVARELSALGFD